MDVKTLRRADLRSGSLLLVLAIAMLAETSTFPITDSYGGVRNVWYVSPALLPLIIGSSIAILSIALIVNAILCLGVEEARASLRPRLPVWSARDTRFAMIVLAIVGYVFVLVPRVDFFIASALFLLLFAAPFHLEADGALRRNLAALIVVCIVVTVLALVVRPSVDSPLRYLLDIAATAAFFAVAVMNWLDARGEAQSRRRYRVVLIVSLAVPLLLCPVFRYFLLVPLPHEGMVMEVMETVRYSLRD